MANYIPISLVSNLGKFLEKILKCGIVRFLQKYNIISSDQYGFLEGTSTEGTIHCLTLRIYRALDNRIPIMCIFVNLSKTFECGVAGR